MIIRQALPSDAAAVAELTTQLGYPSDVDSIRNRLTRIGSRSDDLVVVAILEERIAGWMQVHASEALESGLRVEIVGLVVSEQCRRRGVGRSLVEFAERWALGQGAEVLVVRSNVQRSESHDFYPALGFSAAKTQTVYRKRLPPDNALANLDLIR